MHRLARERRRGQGGGGGAGDGFNSARDARLMVLVRPRA